MTLDCVKLTATANLDRKYNCLGKRCGETSQEQLLLIMLFNYGGAMMKTHAYVNDISHRLPKISDSGLHYRVSR